ncbi:energy transducer TonB [Dyella sp. GSA-30]|uniref:energy transducer TonB n=1 Tax=Dyella sp. GSA-30 TaxID=2994496 RepID=UPI002492A739|nr:energy transducer TonB [Dyella sp. GSA-30]
MAPQIAEVFHAPAQMQVRWIMAEPLPPVPPDVVIPKPHPVVVPKAIPKPAKQVEQPPPTSTHITDESANPVQVVDTTQTLVPPSPVPAPVTEPVETSLAYRTAPLAYPKDGITRHLEGTVLLRVLVDETGKPIDVVIEKSSGQRILDRSAQDQVLQKWLFQPAVVQGQHVKAWARVPVTFNLNQL